MFAFLRSKFCVEYWATFQLRECSVSNPLIVALDLFALHLPTTRAQAAAIAAAAQGKLPILSPGGMMGVSGVGGGITSVANSNANGIKPQQQRAGASVAVLSGSGLINNGGGMGGGIGGIGLQQQQQQQYIQQQLLHQQQQQGGGNGGKPMMMTVGMGAQPSTMGAFQKQQHMQMSIQMQQQQQQLLQQQQQQQQQAYHYGGGGGDDHQSSGGMAHKSMSIAKISKASIPSGGGGGADFSQGMSVHHLQPMMPHHGGGGGGGGYDGSGGFALDVSKAYVSPYSQKHKGGKE